MEGKRTSSSTAPDPNQPSEEAVHIKVEESDHRDVSTHESEESHEEPSPLGEVRHAPVQMNDDHDNMEDEHESDEEEEESSVKSEESSEEGDSSTEDDGARESGSDYAATTIIENRKTQRAESRRRSVRRRVQTSRTKRNGRTKEREKRKEVRRAVGKTAEQKAMAKRRKQDQKRLGGRRRHVVKRKTWELSGVNGPAEQNMPIAPMAGASSIGKVDLTFPKHGNVYDQMALLLVQMLPDTPFHEVKARMAFWLRNFHITKYPGGDPEKVNDAKAKGIGEGNHLKFRLKAVEQGDIVSCVAAAIVNLLQYQSSTVVSIRVTKALKEAYESQGRETEVATDDLTDQEIVKLLKTDKPPAIPSSKTKFDVPLGTTVYKQDGTPYTPEEATAAKRINDSKRDVRANYIKEMIRVQTKGEEPSEKLIKWYRTQVKLKRTKKAKQAHRQDPRPTIDVERRRSRAYAAKIKGTAQHERTKAGKRVTSAKARLRKMEEKKSVEQNKGKNVGDDESTEAGATGEDTDDEGLEEESQGDVADEELEELEDDMGNEEESEEDDSMEDGMNDESEDEMQEDEEAEDGDEYEELIDEGEEEDREQSGEDIGMKEDDEGRTSKMARKGAQPQGSMDTMIVTEGDTDSEGRIEDEDAHGKRVRRKRGADEDEGGVLNKGAKRQKVKEENQDE